MSSTTPTSATPTRTNRRHGKLKIVLLATLVALLGCIALFVIYVANYSHADDEAMRAMESAQIDEQGRIVFSPSADMDTGVGIVFYPGGKVQEEAYAPLGEACAQRGITFIICPMPLNLAMFDLHAADGAIANHPEVQHWYLAGHSLGGAMGAEHLEATLKDPGKHAQVEGFIMLAAYSASNLSETDLPMLCLRGTEDGVFDAETHEKNHSNIPENHIELDLEGGNHAGFGSYGIQKGDGQASISQQEQVSQTADAIAAFALERTE